MRLALLIDRVIRANGSNFSTEYKSRFNAALIKLQKKLYIKICGARQKISLTGVEYGWRSMMFCTVEKFWGKAVFEKAKKISASEATETITEQIYKLNPDANARKIRKFIEG